MRNSHHIPTLPVASVPACRLVIPTPSYTPQRSKYEANTNDVIILGEVLRCLMDFRKGRRLQVGSLAFLPYLSLACYDYADFYTSLPIRRLSLHRWTRVRRIECISPPARGLTQDSRPTNQRIIVTARTP